MEDDRPIHLRHYPQAIMTAKSKDYLLGYMDCMVASNRSKGLKRTEIFGDEALPSDRHETLGGDLYFDLTCPECGNYIGFKGHDDVPEKSFKCTLCEKIYMILYTDEFEENNDSM